MPSRSPSRSLNRHEPRRRLPAGGVRGVWGVWVVIAGLVATAVSACGAIPDSGAVHAGATLEGPPPVRVLAAPPRTGASAADIVRGFLRAQPGLDDDEAVARLYLAGSAAPNWATHPKVTVYPDESSLRIVAGAGGAFTVTTAITATVDADGIYTTAPAGAKATLKLQLRNVFGQWRIVAVDDPQSLWLTSYDIERVYAQVPLYYGAPGTRVLVPDIRWFPQTSGLATVIARAQLAAPPAYLRGAVSSGIPAHTGLVLDSVPSTGSVASVDLDAVARQASSADRTLLWAQLAASVTAAPGVDTVRVLVDGKVLDLPGTSVSSGTTAGSLGFATDVPTVTDPVALTQKAGKSVLVALSGLGGGSAGSVAGGLPVPSTPLRSIARSTDGREFAGVTANGSSLVRLLDGKTSVVFADGANLTRPSYDTHRWLWTVSSGPGLPTRLHTALTGPGLGAKDVALGAPTASWLADRQVTALRISRDGTRALVTSVRRGVWRIDVAGIVRDSHGAPVSLLAPLTIGVGLADVTDATWLSPTAVGVLAKGTTDKRPEPYQITIGAESVALPQVANASAIAAGNGGGSIVVITTAGVILGPGGPTGWVPVGTGSDVAFSG